MTFQHVLKWLENVLLPLFDDSNSFEYLISSFISRNITYPVNMLAGADISFLRMATDLILEDSISSDINSS